MSHFLNEIPFLGTYALKRGADFSLTFYLGSYQDIDSSTDANPSVITVPAHGFSSTQKKQIRGHLHNTAINNTAGNPFHTITVIDANTFSVPVAGTGDGYGGTVMTPENLTGSTVLVQLRQNDMDTATAGSGNVLFTPTLSYGTRTEGTVAISIEKALTYKEAVGGLTLDKYRGDILVTTAAGADTIFAQFDIQCFKSVTR